MNIGDVQQKLSGTIVNVDNSYALYVHEIESLAFGAMLKGKVVAEDGDLINRRISTSNKNIYFNNVTLGYIIIGSKIVYVEKLARRQWAIGYNTNNTSIVKVKGPTHDNPFRNEFSNTVLLKIINKALTQPVPLVTMPKLTLKEDVILNNNLAIVDNKLYWRNICMLTQKESETSLRKVKRAYSLLVNERVLQ